MDVHHNFRNQLKCTTHFAQIDNQRTALLVPHPPFIMTRIAEVKSAMRKAHRNGKWIVMVGGKGVNENANIWIAIIIMWL